MPITTSALPALPVGADTRSMTERVNAIIKNLYNKLLPVGATNTVLTSDGTTFSWAAIPAGAITNTGATTFLLTSNLGLSTTPASPTSVVNTGSLPPGTYLIIGQLGYVDTGSAGVCTAGISNGTSLIAAGEGTGSAANLGTVITMAAVVTFAVATTFTMLACSNNANGFAVRSPIVNTTFSPSASDKMTSITAVRLA